MKVTTKERGVIQVELTATEQRDLRKAHTIIHKLGYHYAGTDFGESSSDAKTFLQSILEDLRLCPAAKTDNKPKETTE